MTLYQKNAVAMGDLKNAALYFDHLIPVTLHPEQFADESERDTLLERVAQELLPSDLSRDPHFEERLGKMNEWTRRILQKEAIRRHGLEPRIPGLTSSEYEDVEGAAAQAYFDFIEDFGLEDWPLTGKGGPPTASLEAHPELDGCPLLTLSQVPIIDASQASWNQIFDFRKDAAAREKLRRLRLFAFENYSGKQREYVEDDLRHRISEYKAVAERWGLETVQGALALVINSKLAAGVLAGSFLSALFGQPAAAVLAAGFAAATEIGHFGLELRRRRVAFQAFTRDNPVSYLIYTEEKLGDKTAR